MTQIRHHQLGITNYVSRTSQDERVKPSRATNEGLTFEWANPPVQTGNPSSNVMGRHIAEPNVMRSQVEA